MQPRASLAEKQRQNIENSTRLETRVPRRARALCCVFVYLLLCGSDLGSELFQREARIIQPRGRALFNLTLREIDIQLGQFCLKRIDF